MFHFENYSDTWRIINFSRAFFNSIKLTATAIVTACIAAGCMGYVLAGKKVRTWKFLTIYFMLATTVPLQLFMLPLYSIFVKLHIMGNPFALGVVIAAWDLPMPIFLMRTYFLKVPFELEEAACIDGAGTFRIFSLIMLPIVSPGLITVAVIVGLFSWNEYLLSSTLLQGDANLTASIKFMSLNGMYSANFNVVMAGAVIMIVPILIIFLLLQKRFIEGMASGAVKG
jgi:raffinose/stachyose/melibiose transport system permease protein